MMAKLSIDAGPTRDRRAAVGPPRGSRTPARVRIGDRHDVWASAAATGWLAAVAAPQVEGALPGGIENVGTQELALVEEAVKTKLILDSVHFEDGAGVYLRPPQPKKQECSGGRVLLVIGKWSVL
jgi:hypothetical protein